MQLFDMILLIIVGVALNVFMKIAETNKIAKGRGLSYGISDYWGDFKWSTIVNLVLLFGLGYIFARSGYAQSVADNVPVFLQLFLYLLLGFAPETIFRRVWVLIGNTPSMSRFVSPEDVQAPESKTQI